MIWQDWALTAGSIVFIIALIPTLLSTTEKPALSTSIMNGAVLAVMALVYLSLSLWLAAVTTAISCLLWCVLATQTYILRR